MVSDGLTATAFLAFFVALSSTGGCIAAYRESGREHNERVGRENEIIDRGDEMRTARAMEYFSKQRNPPK